MSVIRFEKAQILLAVCFVIYVGFVLPLVPLGSDDIRVVSVFSIDEADIQAAVGILHKKGFLEKPSFKYGGLYYYLPVAFLKLYGILGEVTDRVVIMVLRGFGAISGVGCLWMVYRIGSVTFGQVAGLIGTFILLVTPVFLRWSVEAHPDLPQLFWILCALYAGCRICEGIRPKWIVLASLFSGLAFGTKYAGIFLLPAVYAAVLLPSKDGALSLKTATLRLRQRQVLVYLGLVPVVFVLVFAVTNPFSVIFFEEFTDSLMAEKKIMEFGHTLRADTRGFLWFSSLAGGLGRPHAVTFLITLLAGAFHFVKGGKLHSKQGVLLIWIGVYLAYLALEVNFRQARHLLPIIPVVLLFAADGYRWIGDRLKVVRPLRGAGIGLAAIVIGFSLGQMEQAAGLYEGKWNRVRDSLELRVGRWLAGSYQAETSVLHDAYAYVPSKFQNVFRTFGHHYPLVSHFEPDLLVIREAIRKDYENIEDADDSRMGKPAFLDRHFFYRHLAEGRIATYRLVKDFGRMQVYGRVAPRVREWQDPSERWLKLAKMKFEGKLYGMVSARWTMGSIHMSLGLAEHAEREYSIAKASETFAIQIYQHGKVELSAGRLPRAREAFDAALEAVSSKPPRYRAAVLEKVVTEYFKAGYFSEASAYAEAATELDPALPGPFFQVAVARLADGQPDRADSSLTRAVGRFGPDRNGADMLQRLIQRGIAVEAGMKLLDTHFEGITHDASR